MLFSLYSFSYTPLFSGLSLCRVSFSPLINQVFMHRFSLVGFLDFQTSDWKQLNCSTRSYLLAAAAAKSLQSCPTLCDPIDSSTPSSPCPWDSLGKNTGLGFHFLLQCMKVKSEREVAQSCPTLSHPMDCSLPGSFFHSIFQARILERGAIAFSDLLAIRRH